MSKQKKIYRVRFVNEGNVFEVYTKVVSQSYLYGFVEIGEVVFGERSSVIVDPTEQELISEFSGVSCSHIPMQAIMRIDEVKQQGAGKISKLKTGSKIAHIPVNEFRPDKGS